MGRTMGTVRKRKTKGLFTWKRGTRTGEVPHLPAVKKYLSSHATLGTQSEVQNAIARSHVRYFGDSSTRLGVPTLTFGGFRFDLFADLF